MTDNKRRDDGGRAFPREDYQNASPKGQVGMSLRDWFAGQALAALEAHWDGNFSRLEFDEGKPDEYARLIASSAYRIADFMLALRKKDAEG